MKKLPVTDIAAVTAAQMIVVKMSPKIVAMPLLLLTRTAFQIEKAVLDPHPVLTELMVGKPAPLGHQKMIFERTPVLAALLVGKQDPLGHLKMKEECRLKKHLAADLMLRPKD